MCGCRYGIFPSARRCVQPLGQDCWIMASMGYFGDDSKYLGPLSRVDGGTRRWLGNRNRVGIFTTHGLVKRGTAMCVDGLHQNQGDGRGSFHAHLPWQFLRGCISARGRQVVENAKNGVGKAANTHWTSMPMTGANDPAMKTMLVFCFAPIIRGAVYMGQNWSLEGRQLHLAKRPLNPHPRPHGLKLPNHGSL